MAPPKINIKDRFNDGEIDLSMSDLQEIPVKEIALFKKAYSLDLSNNHLTTLPNNFSSLTHIMKLDLSKNKLKELPENFGDLTKLKYLDLYQNQLTHLPLSFSKLQSLRWLDLKDNPLVPAVSKIAGQCLDAKQCQSCAKNVTEFFKLLQEKVDEDLIIKRQQEKEASDVINNQQKVEKKKKNKAEKLKKASTENRSSENGLKATKTKEIIEKKSDVSFVNKVEKKSSFSVFVLMFFAVFPILFLFFAIKLGFIDNKFSIFS